MNGKLLKVFIKLFLVFDLIDFLMSLIDNKTIGYSFIN